ncbi:MAG: YceI family protein [Cyclobacteriaceae bacterium]
MKATKVLLITAWVLALQFSNQVLAQTFSVKTCKVTVRGTSSMHEWESTVEKLEAKGSFVVTNNSLTDIQDVVLKIPVKAIKSTKGRMMDNKTYDAFNHEKNPNILFTLTGKTITQANTMNVSGKLTMAGITKEIDLILRYKVLPGGELQVSGSKKLNMTEYKMEPPTAMLGAIVVGEEVTVTFEIVLTQSTIVKAEN